MGLDIDVFRDWVGELGVYSCIYWHFGHEHEHEHEHDYDLVLITMV
jgi:hypothetical protein